MADTKISALASSTAAVGDTLPVSRGGANYRVTAQSIAALGVKNSPNTVYVNDFYPSGATGVPSGASNPLSNYFATLAAAQAVYPHAAALTDETDWAAWQAAIEYAYQNCTDDYWKNLNYNMSTATIVADGNYVVNRSIQVYLASCTIRGSGQPSHNIISHKNGGTTIVYSGAVGTVDDHAFVFDVNAMDVAGNPPAGKNPVPAAGGTIFRMYDLAVCGRQNGVTGITVDITADPDTSGAGYVIGLFLRNGSFCEISRCTFAGGLYDGLVATSQLFLKVSFCYFYKIYRDSLAIWAIAGDFSTTVWIDDNEFGYNGRYALVMDYTSAIEPAPSVRRNSIESNATNSWYYVHPEYWVQGVNGPQICHIGGTYGMYQENRFEGNPADLTWANVHVLNISYVRFLANRVGGPSGIVLSGVRNTSTYTTAYNSYRTAKGYVDITDQRNINAPIPGNTAAGCAELVFDNLQGVVIVPDGGGWGTSNNFEISNSNILVLEVPTTTGTYADLLQPVGTAIPTMRTAGPAVFTNTLDRSAVNGSKWYRHFTNVGSGDGTYSHFSQTFPNWAASTAYKATWTPPYSTALQKKWVWPTTYNGYMYECTVSGTSGTVEPTWPTTVGNTVADGTCTWKCLKRVSKVPTGSAYETMMNGKRRIVASATPTASDGWFNTGDTVYYPAPSAGGSLGEVCVTAGIPGTWKTFGAISA